MHLSGIQPHQNLGSMELITKGSSGTYDGRAFGREMILK
jgi:hypothetical protein